MNNKKFIRFLIVAAVIVGGIFLFIHFYNDAELISDTEAQKILSELVPKSEKINEIIWGKGLDVAEGQDPKLESVTAAQYRLVSEDSPYKNTEELRKAIAEVYSEGFIEKTIEYTAFKGAEGALEESVSSQMYPRYKDNDAGQLLIDITNPGWELNTVIDSSTAKVVDAERGSQTIEVKATIEGEKTTLKLVIVEQENGWRLDTPTY